MNDINDLKELVQKAVIGDKAAFEALYRETCRSVYFTCFGFLKDEQEAQDVTQDVYLTAFEQIGMLEDAGKFKPWIYRMAANKCINCLKKKQPILPGDEQLQDMETEEDENFLPEEYALNADKRELVLKIIQETCSDKMYQTILLYYFNEFSIAEIAEIMECLEGTVKNRLSVARAKIKEGVLRYEKRSGDKLHSLAVIPFLTTLFTAQMQDMQMPLFPLGFLSAIPKPSVAASSANVGSRMVLKDIQVKIAAGIAAAVVVVGGVTAAVVITNQHAGEASVGAQDASTLDIAGLENTKDTEFSSETATDETESKEDALQEGIETTTESEREEEPESTEGGSTETEEESETAGSASEGIPELTAEPEYTYTDMEATMYASQTVNVRLAPDTSGEKVGALSANQEVNITGQCNETGWYRFEYNGATAYVSNSYVTDTKIEAAAAEQAASSDTSSSSSSNLEGLEQYPVYTWLDYGDWFLYIAPDGQNHAYDNGVQAAMEQTIAMMDAFDSRYPGQDYNGFWTILKNGTRVDCFTVQDPWPQGFIDFMKKYRDPNFVPYR